MSKVQLQLGGEIDVVSKEEMDSSLQSLFDRLSLEKDTFIPRRISGTQRSNAGGNVLIDLGSPPAAHLWSVMVLSAWVLDPANPDNTGGLNDGAHAASYTGDAANGPSLVDLVDPAGPVPNSSAFGKDQLICVENENLYVVFSGTVAGHIYGATARVHQRRNRVTVPKGL